MEREQIKEQLELLTDYAKVQLGSGIHTSRVVRNTRRLGKALGLDVALSTFHKNLVISLTDPVEGLPITHVASIPELPISFSLNSSLSALSWEALDDELSSEEIRRRFEAARSEGSLDSRLLALCVGVANAAFCRLFGGDVIAMAIVFVATAVGFFLKSWLTRRKMINYFVVVLSAFIASAIASVSLMVECTSEIALATSPLFLVPGVPLINGFIDIVEGHVLIGLSRLVSALLTIICIAVGLSMTLMLFLNHLI